MKKSEIKTIWFDLGNVILNFDFKPAFQRIARFTHFSPHQIKRYFDNNTSLGVDCDEGRMPASALFKLLKRDLSLNGISYKKFKAIWNEIFDINPAMVKLVKGLKRNGYRLILISNTNRLHFDYIKVKYPIVNIMDKHILSFRVRTSKPKRRIYQLALKHSKAKSHEILYTDDRKDLTTAAFLNHGIQCHTFRHASGLKQALTKLGVEVQ